MWVTILTLPNRSLDHSQPLTTNSTIVQPISDRFEISLTAKSVRGDINQLGEEVVAVSDL
jgi:hypothetical protein